MVHVDARIRPSLPRTNVLATFPDGRVFEAPIGTPVGDILRVEMQNGTEIGRQADAVMARGELVSDDVMIGIVRERLDRADCIPGFILDGFPRTVAQAAALDAIMSGRDALTVVDIVVPEMELVRRLASRLICGSCGLNAEGKGPASGTCQRCGGQLKQRVDDSEGVVLERLKVYHRNTEPLIEYYRARPTFRSIDGTQPPDRVAAALAAAVRSVANQGSAA